MRHISIIIPAYNEADQLHKLSPVIEWACTRYAQVLVVDDGSSDGTTLKIARSNRDGTHHQHVDVWRKSHGGKAAALIYGMLKAEGLLYLLADLDGATPIGNANHLYTATQNGVDLAIGSRGRGRNGAPLTRRFLSGSQRIARRLMLGSCMGNIIDTQCGFKMVRAEVARHIIENLRVYHPDRLGTIPGPNVQSGFDVEFIYTALRLGYRVQEVPVEWEHQRSPRVSPLRDAVRGLADLARIRAAWK